MSSSFNQLESEFRRLSECVPSRDADGLDNEEAELKADNDWIKAAKPVCDEAGKALLNLVKTRKLRELAFWQVATLEYQKAVHLFVPESRQEYRTVKMEFFEYWLLFTGKASEQAGFLADWDPPDWPALDESWQTRIEDMYARKGGGEQYMLSPWYTNPDYLCSVSIRAARLLSEWCDESRYVPTRDELCILEALADAQSTMTDVELATVLLDTEYPLSRTTIGKYTKRLRNLGLIDYPHGERKGASLTKLGRSLLRPSDPT